MKKANKCISFLLAIMLLLGCVTPISVSAATVTTFYANNISAQPGETITIPVMVKNNTGFVSASLYIEYNSSVLTLIGAKDKGLIGGAMHTTNFVSPYILSWENDIKTSNYIVNGTLVELSFSVSTFADPGEYSVKISSPTHGVLDCNGDEVDCSFVNGKVTVVAPSCDHDWSVWKKSSASRHKRSCDLCGEVEYESHNFDDGEIVEEPSHGVDGEIEYTCDDCGYVDSDILDAEEHDWNDWNKYNDTQHKRTCSCGDVEYENHNWDNGIVTKEPTATEPGVKTYTCEDCEGTKTESIEPDGIPVQGVTLNKTSIELFEGEYTILEALVYPNNATNQEIIWESDNSSVAKVSHFASVPRAKVYALTEGKATVTVKTKDGGFIAECVVTVVSKDTSGFVTEEGGTRYYYENGSYAIGFTTIEGKTYYFYSNGYLFEGESMELWSMTYYFNPDHTTKEGLILDNEGYRYYVKGVRNYGWIDTDADGNWDSYFFTTTQLRCEEDRQLFDGIGARRFFLYNEETGHMERANGFYTNENGTQFFKNGIGQYGWITADGVSITDRPGITLSDVHYFAYGDGLNFYMVEDETKMIGGVLREFDENHLVKSYTGWATNKTTGNANYYVDGVMQQGWCETPDGWVYLSRSENLANNITYGDVFYGWRKIGGKVYYFRASTSNPAYVIISDPERQLTYNGVRSTYYINQTVVTGTGADYYITNPPAGF